MFAQLGDFVISGAYDFSLIDLPVVLAIISITAAILTCLSWNTLITIEFKGPWALVHCNFSTHSDVNEKTGKRSDIRDRDRS